MSTNSALLTASLAALAFALPAQAQDDLSAASSDEIVYESYEVVQGAADAAQYDEAYEEVYEEAYEYETYVDPAPGHHAMRTIPARPAYYPIIEPDTVVSGGAYGQPRGYTTGQRADWISDCRTIYLDGYAGGYYDEDLDRRSYRLDQADAYCQAYLARYEQGGLSGYPVGAYPMMMVPMQTTRRFAPREVVHEEWVDVDAAPRPARRTVPRREAPQPEKRTPIR